MQKYLIQANYILNIQKYFFMIFIKITYMNILDCFNFRIVSLLLLHTNAFIQYWLEVYREHVMKTEEQQYVNTFILH